MVDVSPQCKIPRGDGDERAESGALKPSSRIVCAPQCMPFAYHTNPASEFDANVSSINYSRFRHAQKARTCLCPFGVDFLNLLPCLPSPTLPRTDGYDHGRDRDPQGLRSLSRTEAQLQALQRRDVRALSPAQDGVQVESLPPVQKAAAAAAAATDSTSPTTSRLWISLQRMPLSEATADGQRS